MRPLHLTMQAFGPFAGEEALDFGDLGEHGLFLVHGRTGAGKTTVLDAICFALYGESSGNERSGKELRSDFAAAELPTEVRFDFSHGGGGYRIVRRPAQERPKKRGEGTTPEGAKVTFSEIGEGGKDGKVLASKQAEVRGRVEELLGLNAEQFRQVIMIPQGRFRDLLVADTGEREAILQTIFETGRFAVIQEALKEKAKRIVEEREKEDVRREEILRGAGVEDAAALAELLAELGAGQKAGEKAKVAAAKKHKAVLACKGELAGAVELGQKIVDLTARVKEAEKAAAAAGKLSQGEAKTLAVAEREAGPRVARLQKEIGRLEKLEPQVARHAKALAEVSRLQAELEGIAGRERVLGEEIGKAEEALEKSGGEDEKLAARAAEADGCRRRLESAVEALEAAGALRKVDAQLAEARAGREGVAREGKAVADLLKSSKGAKADLERRYREGRAAGLAAELEEGAPCPVCGSTSHPAPAEGDGEIPDEAALDAAEAKVGRAEREKQQLDARYQALQKDEERAAGARERLLVQLGGEDKLAGGALAKEKVAAAKALEISEAAAKKLEEARRHSAKLKKELAARREEREKLRAEREEKGAALASAKAQGKELGEQLEEALRVPGAIGANLEERRSELAKIDASLAARRDKKVAAETALAEARTQAAELGRQLAEEKETYAARRGEAKHKGIPEDPALAFDALSEELGGLDAAEVEARAAADEASAALGALEEKVKGARKSGQKLKKSEEDNAALDAEFRVIGTIAEVANGKRPPRITFRRFVLGVLLEDVVATATRRLHTMSRGRYELQRAEGPGDARAAGGLDLEVYDSYTGCSRPVATLSGGESFLAALALALALADVTATYAGGVTMETMFIDEGFGSLDAEGLDLAFKTLCELQEGGRLVGVISHVAELQERIEMRLEVTATRSGSSARFVV